MARASSITMEVNGLVVGPCAACDCAKSAPAASFPRAAALPRSSHSATSTSDGENRNAGNTFSTNQATPPPTSIANSTTRMNGGNRSSRSSTTATTTASSPNAIACDRRSITKARRTADRVFPIATNTPSVVVVFEVGWVSFIVI